MNKVISIHLCGIAFQLEESGYDALRSYLDKAGRQLASNPDKDEIVSDIERAIADKFRTFLSAGRNVILADEVDAVIKEMGPVTDEQARQENSPPNEASSSGNPSADSDRSTAPQPRKLYRLRDGAMLGGVCNGLAAYAGVDVTLLRLLVAILVFFSFGTVAIAYIVGVIIIPLATTQSEKSQATGPMPTAQEFIRRAKQGYYEGFKSLGNRAAHRAWKQKFKHEMKDWKRRMRDEYGWTGFQGCQTQPLPPKPPVAHPYVVNGPAPESAHIMITVLSTLKAVLTLAGWFVAISLLATGHVFGHPLPWQLPVWAGIVLVIIACNLVNAPIKALRRYYLHRVNGWTTRWNPFIEVWGVMLAIVLITVPLLFAFLFVPGAHDVIQNIPVFLKNATDTIQQWWTHKP